MSNYDRQENIEDPIRDPGNFDCKKEIGNELIITIKDAINFIVRRNIRWMNWSWPEHFLH